MLIVLYTQESIYSGTPQYVRTSLLIRDVSKFHGCMGPPQKVPEYIPGSSHFQGVLISGGLSGNPQRGPPLYNYVLYIYIYIYSYLHETPR